MMELPRSREEEEMEVTKGRAVVMVFVTDTLLSRKLLDWGSVELSLWWPLEEAGTQDDENNLAFDKCRCLMTSLNNLVSPNLYKDYKTMFGKKPVWCQHTSFQVVLITLMFVPGFYVSDKVGFNYLYEDIKKVWNVVFDS